jgi:hypothetical protein
MRTVLEASVVVPLDITAGGGEVLTTMLGGLEENEGGGTVCETPCTFVPRRNERPPFGHCWQTERLVEEVSLHHGGNDRSRSSL